MPDWYCDIAIAKLNFFRYRPAPKEKPEMVFVPSSLSSCAHLSLY